MPKYPRAICPELLTLRRAGPLNCHRLLRPQLAHMFKTANRNRKMFAVFQAGQTIEQLCQDHGLSKTRIQAILADEKNRQTVSPEPFYRALRKARAF
jgi:hypothetical protein